MNKTIHQHRQMSLLHCTRRSSLPCPNSSQVTALRNTEAADAILLQHLYSNIRYRICKPKLCHLLRRFGFKCRGDRVIIAPTWVLEVLKPKKTSLGMSHFDGKRLAGVWCYSRPRCKHSVFKARGGNSTGFRVRRISALETTLRRSQEFDSGLFEDLLEHKTPTRMDPLKGRIRSFLLDSTQNYPANEAERNRCLKRGGGLEFICLDLQDVEEWSELELIDNLTPEKVFAARRALMLLKHAIHQRWRLRG
jgi:hypothetical protein